MGAPAWLLHPMFVHFPIAVLVLGFLAGAGAEIKGRPAWVAPALPWALAGGTLLLWGALGLGLLAEATAPHVPAAWRALADHKRLAWIAAGAFSALCGLWFLWGRRHPRWTLALWALALLPLVLAAHRGAELVYTYGLGSAQP